MPRLQEVLRGGIDHADITATADQRLREKRIWLVDGFYLKEDAEMRQGKRRKGERKGKEKKGRRR